MCTSRFNKINLMFENNDLQNFRLLRFHDIFDNVHVFRRNRRAGQRYFGWRMSVREQLNQALKEAMRAKDQDAVATLRLILAALKDRDIAARGKGQGEISDDEILLMLQTMVKQRRESIAMYEQGGRLELAQTEQKEIDVIERFLPKQLSEAEMAAAIDDILKETGAGSLKEMGNVMRILRDRYAGQMDFGKASGMVKQKLA